LRSRRFTAFVLVIVVVAAVGETLMSLRHSTSADSNVRPGSVFIPEGKRAPVILPAAKLLDGGQFDPAPTQGHVSVFNFWASWCPPCQAEAPALAQIAQETSTSGVVFVGVDSQESAPDAGRLFVQAMGLTYTNVFDGDGAMQLAFARAVQLGNLPVTVVLDRNSRVAGIYYGEVRYTDLTALINRVAGGQA
jgi:thiol-disulfide isomerase/thioredoxin